MTCIKHGLFAAGFVTLICITAYVEMFYLDFLIWWDIGNFTWIMFFIRLISSVFIATIIISCVIKWWKNA